MWSRQKQWRGTLENGYKEAVASMGAVLTQEVGCPPSMNVWWSMALSLPVTDVPPDRLPTVHEGQTISRMGFVHLIRLVGKSAEAFPAIADGCASYCEVMETSYTTLNKCRGSIKKLIASDKEFRHTSPEILGHVETWREQATKEIGENLNLQNLFRRYGSSSAKDYRSVLESFYLITLKSRSLMEAIIGLSKDRPSFFLFW